MRRTRSIGKPGRKTGELHIKLPGLHTEQRRVVAEAGRFSVLACGRRWGKSTLGLDRLIEPALYGAPVAFFSPTYKMLTETWRLAKTRLQPVAARINETRHCIELVTGGVVEMWSLYSADTVRGRKYGRVVIDEAAMVRDLGEAWQSIIRPTLTDMRGDAWLLSTPRGRGFFWECFQRGQQAGDAEGWRSWQMPTSRNPYIDAAEIEAARRELPERVFLQEYEAVFLEDAGSVFRRVLEAATAEAQAQALPGHSYCMGVDWARQADFSCFAVVDSTTRELVCLERCNQVDYAVQLGRLQALAGRFQPEVIVAEQNSIGLPLIEQLQRADLPVQPFVTTAGSKARLIEALALALEQGSLRILNDAVLIGELESYQMERRPSGMVRYSAPPAQHDDTVMALALAWSAAGDAGSLVLW